MTEFKVGTIVRIKTRPETQGEIFAVGESGGRGQYVYFKNDSTSYARYIEELEVVAPAWDDVKVGDDITFKVYSGGRDYKATIKNIIDDKAWVVYADESEGIVHMTKRHLIRKGW